jgi:hypothetical protein
MALDPWQVLGIRRDAPLADVDAAYRRLAALFHPDRLRGLRDEARVEGERRFREATEAVETIRARLLGRQRVPPPRPADVWSHHGLPDQLDPAGASAVVYNAQVRGMDANGLHATWPGRHAAGVYAALKRAHTMDGPVQQVEWGAYECTLSGRDVRALLNGVASPDDCDWRHEPLENLEVPRHHRTARRSATVDQAGPLELGALERLIEDRVSYVVTAEVYVGFD